MPILVLKISPDKLAAAYDGPNIDLKPSMSAKSIELGYALGASVGRDIIKLGGAVS
jgi:hypothetical protein